MHNAHSSPSGFIRGIFFCMKCFRSGKLSIFHTSGKNGEEKNVLGLIAIGTHFGSLGKRSDFIFSW